MTEFTEAQLKEYFTAIQGKSLTGGSFSYCPARFKGERDRSTVEDFISTINAYKQIEGINDNDAINEFPLLLEDSAVNWWQEVKSDVGTWPKLLKLLRKTFTTAVPAYRIYMEIFDQKQKPNESTDDFIRKKRALLAQLPDPKPAEPMMIDLVYGLLGTHIQNGVPRESINTFEELLVKAKSIEHPGSEINPQQPRAKRKRCNFCKHIGHVVSECRKKETMLKMPKVECCTCKAPGVFRANCPTCHELPKGPDTVAFNFMETTFGDDLPTITIASFGESSTAYIDTAAGTSVAGRELFLHLLRNGTKFHKSDTTITLADGQSSQEEIYIGDTDILFGNRLLPIKFIALPKATDNQTLIGLDFLEKNGVIVNLGQRYWYFADEAEKKFDFCKTTATKVSHISPKSAFLEDV